MNAEKLRRLQSQVRIGGKGTPRRKKKVMHQSAATDDKKLQSSLKKLSVSTIPGIEEVNIIKDDLTVIHFNNPKAQASLSANTFAVTGHGETKKIVEMLPEILPQLGQDTVMQLRMFANTMSGNQAKSGSAASSALENVIEDDEVPLLVDDFEQVAKMEEVKSKDFQKVQTKPNQEAVKNNKTNISSETFNQSPDVSKKTADKNDKKAKNQQYKHPSNGTAKNKTDAPKTESNPSQKQKSNEKHNKKDVHALKMSTGGDKPTTEMPKADRANRGKDILINASPKEDAKADQENKATVEPAKTQEESKFKDARELVEKPNEIKEMKTSDAGNQDAKTSDVDLKREVDENGKNQMSKRDLPHTIDLKLQHTIVESPPQSMVLNPQQQIEKLNFETGDLKPQQPPKETDNATIDLSAEASGEIASQQFFEYVSQQSNDVTTLDIQATKETYPQSMGEQQTATLQFNETYTKADPQSNDLKSQPPPHAAEPQPEILKLQQQKPQELLQLHVSKEHSPTQKDCKIELAWVDSPQANEAIMQQGCSPQPKELQIKQPHKGAPPQAKDVITQQQQKRTSPQQQNTKPQDINIEPVARPQDKKSLEQYKEGASVSQSKPTGKHPKDTMPACILADKCVQNLQNNNELNSYIKENNHSKEKKEINDNFSKEIIEQKSKENAASQGTEVIAAAIQGVTQPPVESEITPPQVKNSPHETVKDCPNNKETTEQNKQSADPSSSSSKPKTISTSGSALQTKQNKQAPQKVNQLTKLCATKPTDKTTNSPKQTNTQGKSVASLPKKTPLIASTTTAPASVAEVSIPAAPTDSGATKPMEANADNQKKQTVTAQKTKQAKPNVAKPTHRCNKASTSPITPTCSKKTSPPLQDTHNKKGKQTTPPKTLPDKSGSKTKQSTTPKSETQQTNREEKSPNPKLPPSEPAQKTST